MRVFVTGGTGYVGRQVLRALVAAGHHPSALVRNGSEKKIPTDLVGRMTVSVGSIEEPVCYRSELEQCEAVIYLPGLLREFPRKGISFEHIHVLAPKIIVNEAHRAGIRRFLLMSALGVRADSVTAYQMTKFRAEEYLRRTGLEWTIFRPSVLFGNEIEGLVNFFTVLRDLLRMMPFIVPVIGNGKYRFQPVALSNLAEGMVASLTKPGCVRKIYDVAGPDRFSYNELLDLVASIHLIRKERFHLPVSAMEILGGIFGGFKFFPITRDQIIMMREGNTSDHWEEFFKDLKIQPLRLEDELAAGFCGTKRPLKNVYGMR
jgi:NADH dehydrogenase